VATGTGFSNINCKNYF